MQNNRGNTLMSVMIAMGVSAIIMAATVAMFTNQQRNQKRLAQKYEAMDLKNQIMTMLTNPANCTPQLTAINAEIVDVGGVLQPIVLPTLKSSGEVAAITLADADGGSKLLPGTMTGLKVEKMEFTNIAAAGPPNEYWSDFMVYFDQDSTITALAPVTTKQLLKTDGGVPNKVIFCGAQADSTQKSACNNGSAVDPVTGAVTCKASTKTYALPTSLYCVGPGTNASCSVTADLASYIPVDELDKSSGIKVSAKLFNSSVYPCLQGPYSNPYIYGTGSKFQVFGGGKYWSLDTNYNSTTHQLIVTGGAGGWGSCGGNPCNGCVSDISVTVLSY